MAIHDGTSVLAIQRLAHEATKCYQANQLLPAKRSLEKLLLVDGDQPDVLRNLVTISAELKDIQAYERYWRRLVKVLLWRMMRGDDPLGAYDDLVQFYSKVAGVTDREFGDAPQKIAEQLRRPGLLPRWIESHAALTWLESIVRTSRPEQCALSPQQVENGMLGRMALMIYWYRVFYPEYAPFVDVGPAAFTADEQVRHDSTSLLFDPAERMLLRFAEWSKVYFGVKEDERDESPHVQAVEALTGCVARIPNERYAPRVAAEFAKDKLKPEPFRRAMQKACSMAYGLKLKKLFGDDKPKDAENKQDWQGMISLFGDPEIFDKLSPQLRMYLALALCNKKEHSRGLDVASRTLPDLVEEELKEDAECYKIWQHVLQSNINRAYEGPQQSRVAQLAELKRRIQELPRIDAAPHFQQTCLFEVEFAEAIAKSKEAVEKKEFDSALRLIRALPDTADEEASRRKQSLLEQILIEQAIHKSQDLVKDGKFAEAKKVVQKLPESDSQLKKLKTTLLQQINEAERHDRVRKQVDEAIKQSQKLVGERKFDKAKKVIRDLPNDPEELKELKTRILSQIDEAVKQSEEADRIDQLIKDVIKKSQEAVSKGNFDQARRAIDSLPAIPKELENVKRDLRQQVAEAERHAKEAEQLNKTIDAAMNRVKGLIGKGNFEEARKIIRGLPDAPADLKNLKSEWLKQIDEAERHAAEANQLNQQIEGVITKAKNFVGKGKFVDARQAVRDLPNTPAELKKLKSDLLSQIDDAEKHSKNAASENMAIMKRLADRGVDFAALGKIAQDNNVDMSNMLEFNAFLKAVERQIR
jgi:hypothetical protein